MTRINLPLADAPVVYYIRARDPGARILEVFCRVREPDPAGQEFSLPAWIPGSYMIRDFARQVLSLEATSDGAPVPLRKLDKSTWRAAATEAEIILRAEIYANDLSVRGADLDAAGAFFNGSSVFFRVHGRESERCVVHLSPGDDPAMAAWQVATSLTRLTGARWEYGEFEAADYEELIDHPVLMGTLTLSEFQAAGTPHALAIAGRHDADVERLTANLAQLCSWHIEFFGRPAPMESYLFLVRLTGAGFGGLEHRASTALVCHRNHMPRRGHSGLNSEYREFLGLASHEYFHLWNVKRIRPVEFVGADLNRETYTRQLWIFEGITSYYDDIALLRSRLISTDAYLELLGRTLTSVYRAGGRRRQTLEDASFDAWIKFYRPDENSPNALVSYYSKGAMVALALDLEIRFRTEGRRSLDDVMRVLWETQGRDPGRGLPEGAFEELAADVTGLDLADFFRSSLRSTVDPPVGILLAQFGIRLHLRAAEGSGDAGGKAGQRENRMRPWLGLRTRMAQGKVRVAHVLDGGPAQKAGVAADDEIVAVHGIRADPEGFDALLDRLSVGSSIDVHVLRRDELLRLTVTPAEPPKDTCYLTLDDAAGEPAIARRRQWMAPSPGG